MLVFTSKAYSWFSISDPRARGPGKAQGSAKHTLLVNAKNRQWEVYRARWQREAMPTFVKVTLSTIDERGVLRSDMKDDWILG